ncbi:MAG: DUF6057 family protein [Odoribacteraceae bacterium]|jgi:hypothetical protein|nr:DUF6057 family protein [Odoribacteraceae bacterium]
MKKNPSRRNLLEPLLLALFILCYVGLYRRYSFARLQELAPLLPDVISARDLFIWPGAASRLAAAFLSRLFVEPFAGGLFLAALLLGARALLLALRRPLFPFLACVPPLLLFLAIARLDHSIFAPAGENHLVAPSLGFCLALLIALVARRSRRLLVPLFVILGYPLLGFYALFGALLSGGRPREILYAVAWVILFPLLYTLLYSHASLLDAYTAALLLPDNYGASPWNWWSLAGALLAAALLIYTGAPRRPKTAPSRVAGATALLVLLLSTFFLSNRDPSFHALLAAQYHAARDRWEAVLEHTSAVRSPDRLAILYRNLALLKLQRLGEDMFAFPHEGDDMPRYPAAVYIAGSDLFFHHGHLNHAYRWAMERLVQHGVTVDALRVMTRAALLNGEFPLARKHAGALRRVPFHAAEADAYKRFTTHPASLAKASFLPRGMSPRNNRLGEKTALLEPFLLEYYRDAPPDTRETLDLSLAAALTLKDTARFRALFPLYRQNHLTPPRHAREAALLFARLQQQDEESIPGVDAATRRRFERFIPALVDAQGQPENRRSLAPLAKPFGDTYWYYYFAVKNLKTN